MEPDFAALRREFPLLEHKTYLNSGSYCALANRVKAAFETYLRGPPRSRRELGRVGDEERSRALADGARAARVAR